MQFDVGKLSYYHGHSTILIYAFVLVAWFSFKVNTILYCQSKYGVEQINLEFMIRKNFANCKHFVDVIYNQITDLAENDTGILGLKLPGDVQMRLLNFYFFANLDAALKLSNNIYNDCFIYSILIVSIHI